MENDENNPGGATAITTTQIDFLGGSFRGNLAGIFTTVRMGAKWQERVLIGDRLDLNVIDAGGNGEIIASAEVAEVWYGTLAEMPARFLDLNHFPGARTFAGLLAIFGKVYDLVDEIDPDADVTVLTLATVAS